MNKHFYVAVKKICVPASIAVGLQFKLLFPCFENSAVLSRTFLTGWLCQVCVFVIFRVRRKFKCSTAPAAATGVGKLPA